ncbi:MAG: flippase [Candidatus Omnitrophica bacterium]|nr:flippase [Candidatus Omnitrophota bacterium]
MNKNSTYPNILIKNSGLNFLTQIWLLLVFIVTTPIIVHRLGNEAYGIFSLAMVVIGYFSFVDLGLSQATLKFISEYLEKNEEKNIYQLVRVSLTVTLMLGILGGIVIVLITPLLVNRVFNIVSHFRYQAKFTFYLLAAGFPFFLLHGTLQAIPAAFQRFGTINLINGIGGTLQALCATLIVSIGLGLKEVAIVYVVIRALLTLAYLLVLFNLLPKARLYLTCQWDIFKKLLHFGKWIFVSYIIGPIMANLDRLLIGALLSLAAVSYYTVPYGMVIKIGIISGSISSVIFPAFSGQSVLTDKTPFKNLFLRSLRLLVFAIFPFSCIIFVFAYEILKMWIGVDFAQNSAIVTQILTFAVMLNGLAMIPYVAIQGMGRPDITAKLHLAEVPVYIVLSLVLLPVFGINGVAFAWAIRVVLDTILLFWFVNRLTHLGSAALFFYPFKRSLFFGLFL